MAIRRTIFGISLVWLCLFSNPTWAMHGSLEASNPVYAIKSTKAIVSLAVNGRQGSAVYLGEGLFATALHNFALAGNKIEPNLGMSIGNTQVNLSLKSGSFRVHTPPKPLFITTLSGHNGGVWLPDFVLIEIIEPKALTALKALPAATLDFEVALGKSQFFGGFGKSDGPLSYKVQIGTTQMDILEKETLGTVYASADNGKRSTPMQGDSGGPLFYFDADQRMVVTGFTQGRINLITMTASRFTALAHPFLRKWLSGLPLMKRFSVPVDDLNDPEIQPLLRRSPDNMINGQLVRDLLNENMEASMRHIDEPSIRAARIEKILIEHGWDIFLAPKQIQSFVESVEEMGWGHLKTDGQRLLAKRLEPIMQVNPSSNHKILKCSQIF